MDIFGDINYLLVLGTSLLSFFLGALWYSPILFSNVWQKNVGLSDTDIQNGNMTVTMVGSFVCIAIMNLTLALFLKKLELFETVTYLQGGGVGLIVGLFFIFPSMAINMLYGQKPFSLLFIDAGYQTVYLTVAGILFGIWG